MSRSILSDNVPKSNAPIAHTNHMPVASAVSNVAINYTKESLNN